jgi:chromosome segregation ATPase
MSQEIKFTQEELDQIKQIQDKNTEIVFTLGETELEIRLLKQQLESLEIERERIHSSFADLRKQERSIVEELNKKYGAGQVDLQSGIFIPIV